MPKQNASKEAIAKALTYQACLDRQLELRRDLRDYEREIQEFEPLFLQNCSLENRCRKENWFMGTWDGQGPRPLLQTDRAFSRSSGSSRVTQRQGQLFRRYIEECLSFQVSSAAKVQSQVKKSIKKKKLRPKKNS